jgi:hypothetical protein
VERRARQEAPVFLGSGTGSSLSSKPTDASSAASVPPSAAGGPPPVADVALPASPLGLSGERS